MRNNFFSREVQIFSRKELYSINIMEKIYIQVCSKSTFPF